MVDEGSLGYQIEKIGDYKNDRSDAKYKNQRLLQWIVRSPDNDVHPQMLHTGLKERFVPDWSARKKCSLTILRCDGYHRDRDAVLIVIRLSTANV
jgi:hypothetical protein